VSERTRRVLAKSRCHDEAREFGEKAIARLHGLM